MKRALLLLSVFSTAPRENFFQADHGLHFRPSPAGAQISAGVALFFPHPLESVVEWKNLHRKDAKDAKKRKRKKKPDFIAKNSTLPLAFLFLCVLCVFAVQIFLILQPSSLGAGQGEIERRFSV